MKKTRKDRQKELLYKISGWGILIAFAVLLLSAFINIFR